MDVAADGLGQSEQGGLEQKGKASRSIEHKMRAKQARAISGQSRALLCNIDHRCQGGPHENPSELFEQEARGNVLAKKPLGQRGMRLWRRSPRGRPSPAWGPGERTR